MYQLQDCRLLSRQFEDFPADGFVTDRWFGYILVQNIFEIGNIFRTAQVIRVMGA